MIKWANKHDRCVDCGNIDRKHVGLGLCERCYYRVKYNEKGSYRKTRDKNYMSYYKKNRAELIKKMKERYKNKTK